MPLARYRSYLVAPATVRLTSYMSVGSLVIRTYVATVQAVTRRTPGVARITFGGGDLDEYVPKGPDQFLYVLLLPPGRPDVTVDASFRWTAVRRYLRRVHGLPRRSVCMTPYWRSPNHVDADDDFD